MSKSERYLAREKRLKVKFWYRLLVLFVSTVILCVAALCYLYFWLSRYESQSVNGAMQKYIDNVVARNWDAIYEDDRTYFTELNSESAMAEYLVVCYSDIKASGVTFSWADSDDQYAYYDVYYQQNKVSTLQVYKPEGLKVYKVRTLIGANTFTFDVLDDSSFSINGIDISSTYYGEDGHYPGFLEDSGLEEYLPTVKRYSLDNLVHEPEISVDSSTVIVRDYTDNRYYVGPAPSSEENAEYRTYINDTAMAYAKYITEDGTFYDLRQRLLPNTDFYTAISSFDNQWFSTHNSIEFQNVEISEVLPLGENAFVGTIAFNMIISSDTVTQVKENKYQMYFVKDSSGEWLCASIVTVSDGDSE